MKQSLAVMMIALVIAAAFAWTEEAAARAGRGGSGGGRGGRSQPEPARLAPAAPAKAAPAAPADGWRTTAGWLAGGALGGLLLGGSRDGIGLPDVAGVALLAYTALKLLRRSTVRKAPVSVRAGRSTTIGRQYGPAADHADRLGRATFVDPTFDKTHFAEMATAVLATVQQARAARDVGLLGMLVTPEMHAVLRRDCERLKSASRTGHAGRTEGRVTGVGDARVEAGQEEITVRVEARETFETEAAAARPDAAADSLPFAEDWTFTRPCWAKTWRLSAIQPAAR